MSAFLYFFIKYYFGVLSHFCVFNSKNIQSKSDLRNLDNRFVNNAQCLNKHYDKQR